MEKQKTMVKVFHTCSHDTITDILSRLPVKSLIRFKSVSKHWLSLVTNPRFISTHLHRSTKNPSLLFVDSYKYSNTILSLLHDTDFPTLHPVHIPRSMKDTAAFREVYSVNPFRVTDQIFIDILGSCGGLIYISVKFYEIYMGYALWNPATRQIKYLKSHQQSAIYIRFQGFGYNSEIKDFKVVRVGIFFDYPSFDENDILERRAEMDGPLRALVYSWRTDSWKVVEDLALQSAHGFHGFIKRPISIKGELFWSMKRGRFFSNEDFVLAFDTAIEVFTRIDLPSVKMPALITTGTGRPPDERGMGWKIVKFMDSVAIFMLYRDRDLDEYLDVWVMNENQGNGNRGNWTKQFSYGNPVPYPMYVEQKIWTWRDKIIVAAPAGKKSFFLYDPVSQESIQLPMHRNLVVLSYDSIYNNSQNSFFDYVEYAESLVSVDRTKGIVAEDALL